MSEDREPLRERKKKPPVEDSSSVSSSSSEDSRSKKDHIAVSVSERRIVESMDDFDSDEEKEERCAMSPGWSCLFGWAFSLIGVIIIFFVSRKQLQLAIMGFIVEVIMILIALQIAFNYIHA